MSDYREVLQNPCIAFKEIELQNATVKQTPLGLPSLVSGGFALTACLTTQKGSRWAIRCFHKEVPDLQERYRYISEQLSRINEDFFVKFEYQTDGIKVRSSSYPIVKMAWVDGESLSEYVEDNLSNPSVLKQLAEQIKFIGSKLRKLQMAHGDLQHGNILVRNNGRLVLIDYDGIYVPNMPYKQSNEIGHIAFQHPERNNLFFNEKIDNFSIITIYISFLCLANFNAKQIWQKYHTGENLIFSRKDYQDPANSTLFSDLQKNPQIAPLISRFQKICYNRIQDVPSLEEFLNTQIVLSQSQPNFRFNTSFSSVGIQGQFKVILARKTLELVAEEGEKITVVGQIYKVAEFDGHYGKIVFINFGSLKDPVINSNQKKYKTFTVVIFSKGLKNLYKSKGLEVKDLKKFEGKHFQITGLIECYEKNGYYTPQIILEDAYQLVEINKEDIERPISSVDISEPQRTVSRPAQAPSVLPSTKPTPPNNSSPTKSRTNLPPKPAPPPPARQPNQSPVNQSPSSNVPNQPPPVPSQYRTTVFTSNPPPKSPAPASAQKTNQPPTIKKSPTTGKNTTSSTSSSKQSDGCFVVTATFGTPCAEEVIKYRYFRDKWLSKTYFGRIFIYIYYYVGPVLAEYVRRKPSLRRVMAVILGKLAKFLPKAD